MSLARRLAAFLLVSLALGISGCASYEPDPLQQSWQAATGAITDVGLTLVTADHATGTIRGTKGRTEGIIAVRMRADGRVGVEITSRDPDRVDPTLTERLTQAYNRRMGR